MKHDTTSNTIRSQKEKALITCKERPYRYEDTCTPELAESNASIIFDIHRAGQKQSIEMKNRRSNWDEESDDRSKDKIVMSGCCFPQNL